MRGLTLFTRVAPPAWAVPASSALLALQISWADEVTVAQLRAVLSSWRPPRPGCSVVHGLELLAVTSKVCACGCWRGCRPRWMLTVMAGTLLHCWTETVELTRWSNLLCRSNSVEHNMTISAICFFGKIMAFSSNCVSSNKLRCISVQSVPSLEFQGIALVVITLSLCIFAKKKLLHKYWIELLPTVHFLCDGDLEINRHELGDYHWWYSWEFQSR